MQLKEIMSKQVDYVSPKTTIQKASNEMLEHDCGFLPVKENGSLAGVVTDRDITIRGVAKGLDSNATLDQVMTRNVIIAHEDDDVHTAAKTMEEKQIRRLIVLDKDEAIAGVVSLGDIAVNCDEIDLNSELIHAVSEKSH